MDDLISQIRDMEFSMRGVLSSSGLFEIKNVPSNDEVIYIEEPNNLSGNIIINKNNDEIIKFKSIIKNLQEHMFCQQIWILLLSLILLFFIGSQHESVKERKKNTVVVAEPLQIAIEKN